MGPLVAAVAPASQVTLIPTGMLGLLPLHAAWREDLTSPTHRHYALDDITITYAPNARSIAVAKDIAILTTWDHLLAVDEPQPVAAGPLTYSEREVQSALSTFAHHHVLRHEQATREAVLEAVRRYQVFHFSCHGYANFNEPLTSGLVMANNIPLTLGDLFELRLKGARLALLSACETGMTDAKLPDEVVSLSSGLLQAGVAGVIAPLWRVHELSTLILMARYYDLWREEGLTPFEALRQAQIWVRDSTNKEKADYFKRFLPEFGASKTPSASADSLYGDLGWRKLNDRDFAHPYYWAAFGYTGV